MLSPQQIQLLEDYHAHLLPPEGCVEVEQKILADPELGKEANLYFELLDGFKGLELEAFGQSLFQWESKYQEATLPVKEETPTAKVIPISRFFAKYRLAIAAVIVVMLMPLGYYMLQGGTQSQESLFASNFEPYKPLINIQTRAPKSIGDLDPAEAEKEARELLLTQGIDAYNQQNYKTAIQQLSQYTTLAEGIENLEEVRIYLAISNLIENNTDAAKQQLEKILESGKTKSYIDAAEWYLALTFLKEKNMQETKKTLKKIANNKKQRYKEDAAKLLPKLEQYK